MVPTLCDIWNFNFNMKTTLLLLFLPLLISSYNLDVEDVELVNSTEFSTCFGYNVALYSHNSSTGFSSWMFISMPKFKIGSPIGIFYPTGPVSRFKRLSIGRFVIQTTNINSSRNALSIKLITGAAMDVSEKDGSVLVCNPLENKSLYNNDGQAEVATLAGACYSGSVISTKAGTKIPHLYTYLEQNDPNNGFAVHYPRLQNGTPSEPVPTGLAAKDPITGSPMYKNVGTVHKITHRNRTILEEYTGLYLPLFGYAVSSGNYFHKSQLMVAGGAPGWNFVGQVAIMKYYEDDVTPFPIISKINGTDLGEFFGASLATGDLNNDGLDDLIVGAPHWKNDNGRVYIYLGNEEGFTKADIVLEGSVDDALYGYTLTSGDLDNDGFDDLIVAAPWENSGAIYVYNGAANLTVFDSVRLTQKLGISSLKRFGFSLSGLVDVDGNGFRDVAVGAFGAAKVALIRSKPVVKTIISMSTIPSILLLNSMSFSVRFCVHHEPSGHFDGVIIFSVDKDYNRVNETTSKYTISEFQDCSEKTFYLQNVGNYLEDIEIIAEWKFDNSISNCTNIGRRFGLSCPIKSENQNPYSRKSLSFDVDCGADRICQANIFAELEFQGISNSTYIIGSNDLSLLLMIKNHGEPAYSPNVIFYIPEGVFFKDLLPSCHEKRVQQTIMVKCDVGDAVTNDKPKNITLNLAKSSFRNTSLLYSLVFVADIETRSTNEGQSKVEITLKLEANSSIALSGKSYKNFSYFSFKNKPSTLSFEHNYQVSDFGVTPLSTIYLVVLVPCKLGCLKFLTLAQNPRFILSNGFYNCTNSQPARIVPRDVNANQLECEDNLSRHYTQLNTQKSEVINLNCNMPNVFCEQIECEISFLDTDHNFGRLPVELNMELSELIGHTKEKEIVIHFTTAASVHVMNQFDIPGTEIPFPVTTIFYVSPNSEYGKSIFNTILKEFKVLKEEFGIQMILGFILVGLLILGLLVIILKYMGFFERKILYSLKAMNTEEKKEEAMNIEETKKEAMNTEEKKEEAMNIEEIKKEAMNTDEKKKEAMNTEDKKKEAMNIEEIKKEAMNTDEKKKEAMNTEDKKKEAMNTEEKKKEALNTEEKKEVMNTEEKKNEAMNTEEKKLATGVIAKRDFLITIVTGVTLLS